MEPAYSEKRSIHPVAAVFLCLFCFIPMIGVFVGIVAILLGSLTYKNKWLIIFGSAGILFTIIVYSSLFYLGFKKDGPFSNGWNSLAKRQLPQIVSGIEFYKLVNDVYPDSLEQLEKAGYTSIIFDPSQQVGMGKKMKNFYYQKSGDKYYLFSVGRDGKPFTNDDVLPQLTEKEKAKVGLIYAH